MCHISVQPPVNGELILRFQQLQSRLTTLKIENEEVRSCKKQPVCKHSVIKVNNVCQSCCCRAVGVSCLVVAY